MATAGRLAPTALEPRCGVLRFRQMAARAEASFFTPRGCGRQLPALPTTRARDSRRCPPFAEPRQPEAPMAPALGSRGANPEGSLPNFSLMFARRRR